MSLWICSAKVLSTSLDSTWKGPWAKIWLLKSFLSCLLLLLQACKDMEGDGLGEEAGMQKEREKSESPEVFATKAKLI